MLDFRLWLTLIIVGLGCSAAPAQAQGHKESGPPAPASGRKPDDVARWNDRTTPRKALETFYFAISGYDRSPDLIVNAIDCLDLTALDPEMRERDAALLAHQLEFILNRQAIPLYGVPDRPDGDRVVLAEVAGQPIALARQPDGRWRFDSETVGRIGRLRQLASGGQREVQERRATMADGRTDPSATIRSFAGAAMGRRDFAMAARCLDLRDIPPKLRASEGAQLARKLAFVMQRCGFLFTQEIPNDPDGYRYVWHSNHRGRIMLERVRLPEGQDAWLFSRGTLRNLDALVEGHRATPPDPRYATIGVVIGEEVLAAGKDARVPPPPGVPAELGSPRKALRTFLESMDELEFDADRSEILLACLDLDAIPPGDRAGIGLRLAAKLEAVLRRLGVDLVTVADTWEADPLILGRDTEWQVTLARGRDGAWRFDRETISRVPDLFERLTPEEKSVRERRSNFHSAQQTMRTLLHSSDAGDLALAARCLDLDGVPQGARAELGPILAYKLKFVLDRIGRVVLEEIPSEADGPRYYYHRSTLGRIDLVRCAEGIRRGDWLFSRETVAQIEAMFHGAFDRRLSPGLSPDKGVRAGLSLRLVPSLWLRSRLPAWLRNPAPGLEVYQWIGLVARPGGLRDRLVAGTSCPRADRGLCPAPGRARARSGGGRSQAAAAGPPDRPVVPLPPGPAAGPAHGRRRRGDPGHQVRLDRPDGLDGLPPDRPGHDRLRPERAAPRSSQPQRHDRADGRQRPEAGRPFGGRIMPGLSDRQPRDPHPAPGRARPDRPGRVARGPGYAQEFLRDAPADRRAPLPDRRAHRRSGHGGGGREASASARPGCERSRTRC